MHYEKQYLTLSNGVRIPIIGLGTWLMPNKDAPEIIKNAIEIGYIHIDTAQAYENEKGVGLGIKMSNIDRKDIFIQTKVKAEIKNYDEAVKSIEQSLIDLGVDYIDLMIIHCPQPWDLYGSGYRYEKENLQVWKALCEYYNKGKIKSIGVSNFSIHDLKNIMDNSSIKPMVNQIEVHIGETNLDLINFCKENGIVVEAYSPIAHGRLLSNKTIIDMANKYHVSVPQLCIKYTLQLGLVSLPKASSVPHLKDNIDLDFSITEEDMNILKQM